MNLQEIKSHISSTKFNAFYIFTGPEVKVMQIYIDKIATVRQAQTERFDTLADLYSTLSIKSLFKSKRVLILSDDKDFMTNEKVWTAFESGMISPDDTVIIKYSDIDKRSKLYKHFKDSIVEFEPLEPDILVKYIRREIDLSEKYCYELVEICERDYNRILLEIDKIKNFQNSIVFKPHYEIQNMFLDVGTCFEYLVDNGVIYKPPKDAIFDFVDAVCRRQVKKSFKLLEQCELVGEAPITLISVLYNNMKQMLQVQSFEGSDIAKSTGLNPYVIKLTREKMGKYTIGELIYNMKFIRNVEKSIKTGQIESEIAVPYILVNIL